MWFIIALKKILLYCFHISHHIILKDFNVTTQTKLPPDNQYKSTGGTFQRPTVKWQALFTDPLGVSHLQHHRVSLYLMTEASIILLLCILIKRAWTLVTGHFSLGTLWNLPDVSICLRMIFNLFKNQVPT